MALTWDPLLVEYMARELSERFRGRRVQALHLEPTTRTAVLFLEGESLSLELHPRRGTVRVFAELPVFPRSLPLQLEVLAVRSLVDERLLDIELGRGSARTLRTSLVVELLTNQWNAVVVDRRAGTIRTVLWPRESGSRTLRSGQPYRPPQRSVREGATQELSLARWLEILGPVPPERRESILLQRVAYTSRLNARALLGAAMEANGAPAAAVLEEAWRRWCALRERPEPRPCLLGLGDTLHPYPFPLPDLTAEPVASLFEAMARVDAEAERGGADHTEPRTLPGSAVRALQSQLASARRRLEALERKLAEARDPNVLRGQANLILTRLDSVPRHVRDVTLEGFDGEPVSLRMDPRLTPTENAARLYDAAGRAERARERLPVLLTHTRDRIRRLEETLAPSYLAAVTAELLKQLLLAERPGPLSTEDEERALPYRRYRTSGGLEVRVGRSARANDALTFHHSRPDDVWLHARHAAGAHVILRWNRPDNAPARDLHEAATLAALHSRARTSGIVPVDWTRRKYVRKPRGSPPGAVVPDRVRTLFVEPDPRVERKLRVSGLAG